MIDYQERRHLIRKSLKIQPLSHGQVHTCTVGFKTQPQIVPKRYEELRSSLENHGSNLIPIVVRRSESLGDDKEYEVIYGADWVKVAEDIGVEMLWAWVFDLSDTEVAATCEELNLLLETPIVDPTDKTGKAVPTNPTHAVDTHAVSPLPAEFSLADIEKLLDQKFDQKLAHWSPEITVTSPTPTASTGEMGASDPVTAAQDIVTALERLVNTLSDTVNQGAEITIKIQSKSQIDQQIQLQLRRESLQSRYKLMTATQLKNQAKGSGMSVSGNPTKDDLIAAIVAQELSASWDR